MNPFDLDDIYYAFDVLKLCFCFKQKPKRSGLNEPAIFYVPGQRFWSLITRAKPAKVLEPPLFGSRRGGLHALLRRRPCS